MKKKPSLMLPILAIIIIILAAMTIPISDSRDVYITATLELQTLKTKPDIYDIKATHSPHTLISVPGMLRQASTLITAGTMRITAASASRSATVPVSSTLIRGFTVDQFIVLSDVPANEYNVTVTLFHENSQVDSKQVVIQP